MKKLFTLVMALVAMTFCAKAQYLLQEGFEGTSIPAGWVTYDQDGDGYGWTLETSAATPHMTPHVGTGCMYSESFSNDLGRALTPNNWLVTPAIAIPAGSSASLSFWVAGQDADYCSEHYEVYVSTTGNTVASFTGNPVFESITTATYVKQTVDLSAYAGQTVYVAFVHNEVTDQFVFLLDDVEVLGISGETIMADSTLDFGAINMSNPSVLNMAVSAFNLTSPITATTTAPFAVSADGTTFGTTASLAAAGGTLYVQYAPTAAGTDNGTITLTSGTATASIALTGSAFDCSNNPTPCTRDFSNQAQNDCWTIIDANHDGKTFILTDGYARYTYNSNSSANDWLISPAFNFTGTQYATFNYRAGSTTYPERFQVFALGTDTVALTQAVDVTSSSNQMQVLDLSTLNGIYNIGIQCISDADEFYLYIDDFAVAEASAASLTASVDSLQFNIVPMGVVSNAQAVVLSSINLNEAITLSTVAPFELSVDGTTFADTATIPANSTFSVDDTVYVRFAPTTVGTFSETLTIATSNTTLTVGLGGESVDCSAGISLPFNYGFDALIPPTCWTVNDAANYSEGAMLQDNPALIFMEADNLITPEIQTTNAMLFSFDYATYGGSQADEPTTFHVGYSSTNTDYSSFTWLSSESPASDYIETYSTIIPAGAKYVAIEVEEMGSFLYFGILPYPNALFIDNFSLIDLSEPMIILSEESLSFGNVVAGSYATQNVNVTGALLTSNITVTAPAGFEVSADGNTFASTATLQANGGNLAIRFAPTTSGSFGGNVTLASGTATASIAVSGFAVDCSTPATLPFYEDFEDELTDCWQNVDNDGDGFPWMNSMDMFSGNLAYMGNGAMTSASYINNVGALTPDNWLITPKLAFPANSAINLQWYVAAVDSTYFADYYEVLISTTPSLGDFTSVYSETISSANWEVRNVDLSAYAGQNVYLAFRHANSNDIYIMMIDELNITTGAVSIDEYEATASVYPNPANNVLNIRANANINTVEVFNIMGQQVASFDANDVNTTINTSNFANGVYTVRINTENGVVNQKFTVAR